MFKIAGRSIGLDSPPFIIAEMSGNHNQSLDRALKIVEEAKATGVDAIKIQTYTAETMTLDLRTPDFVIDDEKSLWKGNSLYELYDKAHTPWEWHKPIFDKCRELGLICFSTPFDETAVDFLMELGVPAFKIASFENTDVRLLRKVASTGKPLIVSTGMTTLGELDDLVQTVRSAGCEHFVLLKCTSSYPASPRESNLRTIPHLRELFATEVGLSDHTLGVGVPVASVAFGATVIEKHFVLDRSEGGVDSAFSLEPAEMKSLVEETKRAWMALGRVQYGPNPGEKASIRFRRSLYFVKDLKAGTVIEEGHIRAIRPGFGLPVKDFDRLVGKTLKRDVARGTAASWDLV